MAEPNQEPTKTEPFRTFSTQEDFDNFSAHLIKKTEEKFAKEYDSKYRKEIEDSIRAELEKQSKMSAEEKLKEERAKMEQEIKTEKINFNKDVAKDMLTKSGFEGEELEMYLDFVTEDKDASIGKIKKICDNRSTFMEKQKTKIIEELSSKNPQVKITGDADAKLDKKTMSISEMQELKKNNPQQYEELFGKN